MAVLQISDLEKRYGDAIALRGASFQMEPGEVHGLLGENGAGKSTLVKALSGMLVPDGGTVRVAGDELQLGRLAASRSAGIHTAFQELALLPELSVAENLLLARLPRRGGIVSRRRVESEASAMLQRWEVDDIDPAMPAGRLPLSAQQRLEIVRALDGEPRVLILDEPTAALPDTNWLFGHVRAATARGAAVLYISHKLAEIEALCDRGSIMRNGRIVGSFEHGSFDHDALISQMIGRSVEVAFPEREHTPPSADEHDRTMLRVEHAASSRRLHDVSLEVRSGEIVGIAALEGQGQKELFYGIAGAEPFTGGRVVVAGEPARPATPRQALGTGPGIVLVPEERKREGIFPDMSSIKNMTVPVLKRSSRFGLIRSRMERALARSAGEANYLSPDYLAKDVGRLSGGNQQKTILARTALTGARILLMFDPTRGIDPAAKLEVYRTLRRSSADGAAILLYSTEIPELIGMCDRVIVLYAGRIAAEFTADDIDEGRVMASAVGRTASARDMERDS